MGIIHGNSVDYQYQGLLDTLSSSDNYYYSGRENRTGVGTASVFGEHMTLDMFDAVCCTSAWQYETYNKFPLLTTKKMPFKTIATELLWFLSGNTNVKWLQERGCTIWDEWARPDGSLGPVYGAQWRSWPTPDGGHIDQIAKAIETIKTDPFSRRIIVSAWNVAQLDEMALQPCHVLFQFYVHHVPAGRATSDYIPGLSCHVYQRSADVFLGLPFNIASYALLLNMVAQQCDLIPRTLHWSGGDCHLYVNHREQAKLQLQRVPYELPTLRIKRKPPSIFDYEVGDFELVGYRHHPAIAAEVAV